MLEKQIEGQECKMYPVSKESTLLESKILKNPAVVHIPKNVSKLLLKCKSQRYSIKIDEHPFPVFLLLKKGEKRKGSQFFS